MNTLCIRRSLGLALLSFGSSVALVACDGGGGGGGSAPPVEQVSAVYTGSAYGYQAGASTPFLRFDFTQTTYASGRSQTELSICNLTPVMWCFSYSGVVRVNFVQWGYSGTVSNLAPFVCAYRGVVSTNPARIDLGVTTFSLSGINACVHTLTADAEGTIDLEAPSPTGRWLRVARTSDGANWNAELRTADGTPDRAFAVAAIDARAEDRALAAIADDRGALIAVKRAAEGAIELAQLGPAGQVDVTFGTEGRARMVGLPSSLALARDPSGNILVAWAESGAKGIVLQRRRPGGAIDEGFSGAGRIELDPGFEGLEVEAIDVDARGRILVAAQLSERKHVLVWRLDAGGDADVDFGERGLAIVSLHSAGDAHMRVLLRGTDEGRVALAAGAESVLLDEHGSLLASVVGLESIDGLSPGFEVVKPSRRGAWGAARAK